MRKIIVAVIAVLFTVSPLRAEYDPQHTMLALNMAIVSVNRILTTQDRTVLDWEYENIINRLAIGNIEGDTEIRSLFDELLSFISGKRLRQEDLKRLKDSQKHREQEAYYRAMSKKYENRNAPENDSLWGWIASMIVSAVSSAKTGDYDYQASKEQIHREISSESWKLTRQELEDCNRLQSTLLNLSWGLISKYHLPNEYRLTQENISEFLAAMEAQDPAKRLGRLRFIERKFKVYPPYWFFRADSAMRAGNSQECRKCFDRFNEVWRPVLNYDPYKLEAVKYRIRELAEKGVPEGETVNELRGLVETLRDYTAPGDWESNLFAGIVYFALGDKGEAVNCVEYGNIEPGYEREISGVILGQMKQGNIDVANLPGELRMLFEDVNSLSFDDVKKLAEMGRADAQLRLGVMYKFGGYGVKIDHAEAAKWDRKAAENFRKLAEQGNADAQNNLGNMYEYGYGVKQDKSEAVKWYHKSAEQGNAEAQYRLGDTYHGGYGVKQDYTEAAKWYRKAAEQGHADAQFWLGFMYEHGKGVAKDLHEARKWYQKAAEQGHNPAKVVLELIK